MANINEWLSIDKTSGTGNAYVTLTASSSTELQERIASLSIKTRSEEVFLNVKQLAFNNYFVLSKDLISPIWEGGSYSNYVLSNISWTYTSSDWISLSVTSGSVGKTEFNVVVQPNTSEDIRIGFVNIVSSNGVIMGTIKVAQASHNEVNNIIFYTSTDGNSITPYSSTGVVANEYVDGVGALYYADTITEVPQNLFYNRDTLTSVSVPETVTTIKSGAFYYCVKLVSYDFPDTLTTIEADAFRSCDSLAIFDFPSVETIGNYAFSECPLETLVCPSTLKTIGNYGFNECSLTEVSLNEGLESIGEYCFYHNSITTITFPNSLTSLGSYAFDGNALEKIVWGTGLTSIPPSCFRSNNSLESVIIPSTVTAIESYAFGDCTSLSTVIIEDRTTDLEYIKGSTSYYAFRNCTNLYNAYVPNLKTWFLANPQQFTYWLGNSGRTYGVKNLYVGGELLTEVITLTDYDKVPRAAFLYNPNITSVVITDNVTDIDSDAFCGLSNANYLYIGENAVLNGSGFFSEFEGTLELNNTNSYCLINNYFTKVVFMQTTTIPKTTCSTVDVIEFKGDSITVSATNSGTFPSVSTAIVNCDNLSVGDNLFGGSSFLTEFDFSKVVSIGERAFEGTSITELTNVPLLTSFGDYAFNATKLKTVNLSNSLLTSISRNAFSNCTELTEVILPSLSYTIGSYVFQGCSNLKHIKMVSEGNESAIPTINNYTFYGIAEYGFLEYPLELDYTPWLSTNSYYLGYYNWNLFNVSVNELDFDAASTYDVVIENGIPSEWEITNLPFWLTASVMSGGEGTTTVTFTKTVDYVETEDITITIMDVNYTITAKYSIRELDLTNVDSYTIDLDTEGFTTSGVTDWLTVVSENGTTTFTGGVVYDDLTTNVRFTNGEESYVICCIKDGSETPLPKSEYRIYYTGSVAQDSKVEYNTNADFVTHGIYGGGLQYIEYDRPITHINGGFGLPSDTTRISLPSSLLYIIDGSLRNSNYIWGANIFNGLENLVEIDFGGNELYMGNYAIGICKNLRKFELPQSLVFLGRCSFGGTSKTETMGAETIDIGADMRFIGYGSFNGMNRTKRVNFWGMTPPIFETDNYTSQFTNLHEDCEIHAPIGSDYSSFTVSTGLNYPIYYDLEAKERTVPENGFLYTDESILLKPYQTTGVLFYDVSTDEYSLISLGGENNISSEMVNTTVTKDDSTVNVSIRCCGTKLNRLRSGGSFSSSTTATIDVLADITNFNRIQFVAFDYDGYTEIGNPTIFFSEWDDDWNMYRIKVDVREYRNEGTWFISPILIDKYSTAISYSQKLKLRGGSFDGVQDI